MDNRALQVRGQLGGDLGVVEGRNDKGRKQGYRAMFGGVELGMPSTLGAQSLCCWWKHRDERMMWLTLETCKAESCVAGRRVCWGVLSRCSCCYIW